MSLKHSFRAHELWKWGGGPGLPSLKVPTVSVDAKQHRRRSISEQLTITFAEFIVHTAADVVGVHQECVSHVLLFWLSIVEESVHGGMLVPVRTSVSNMATLTYSPIFRIRMWSTMDAETKVPSVDNVELTNVLPLKPGVGRKIATFATSTMMNIFHVLISTFPVHSH